MSAPPSDEVRLEVEGHVATVTLARPAKLNAMTPAMIETMIAHAARINRDPAVRVAVLRAEGDRAFCAGSDIRELDSYDGAWAFRFRPDYTDAVRGIEKPVVCAINGYCFGGGLEMALAADIRLAAPNATFAAPEIKLGWIGGGGMAFLLAHAAGASNAARMLLTGDPIDAETARAWGLVSEIVPLDALHERAAALAATIASRAPIAAQTAKMNLRAAFSMPREEAVRYERDLQTICFATEDAAEGRAAFKEKRAPLFRGR